MNLEEFSALSLKRQSCRSFSDRAVGHEVLEKIIDAALLAPSARNIQPYKLFVLTKDMALKATSYTQILGLNKFTKTCPSFIAIVEDKQGVVGAMIEHFTKKQLVSIDIGILTSHLVLAATAAGVDTCILGGFRENELKKLLGLDEKEKLRLVIALGYASEGYELREKTRKNPKPVSFLD